MSDRILVVDDDEQMQFMLREALGARGFEADIVADAESALERLRAEPFDLVLLDIRLNGLSGMDALPKVLQMDPQMPVLMMTGHGSHELAVKAMQAGAYDFFEKPFKIDEMAIVIRRALERHALIREGRKLASQVAELEGQLGTAGARIDRRRKLIWKSKAMDDLVRQIEKVVKTDVTVLLHGESGTGKEIVAEKIHRESPRCGGPFVKLNCVAIPETLLESELFGHEKGSFTGATGRKLGKFEQAHTGTILLDEVGDMTLATQAKILRVIQEREFERVGGSETVPVDVRLIAATNKDLAKAVREGTFREDLYYRLNVFSVHVPPLRERKEDIQPLIDRFIAQTASALGRKSRPFSADALRHLETYDWPGNVRELENCVQRALVTVEDEAREMGRDCLPLYILNYGDRLPDEPTIEHGHSLDDTLENLERKLIRAALRRTAGVQVRAAKLLGITERSLWHRVKKLKIDVSKIKAG